LFCNKNDAQRTALDLFGRKINDEEVEEILIQEKIGIEKEYYLSVTIDRFLRRPVVIFSEEGGMEIEEIAEKFPGKVSVIDCEDESCADAVKNILPKEIQGIANNLYELFIREDAVMAEINPLVVTKDGELLAIDSKIIIDNNAISRHPVFSHKDVSGYCELELKAQEVGLSYVELNGDIAVIGNGAGLVMATLDEVESFGGKPANFCDIGGGASAEIVQQAIGIVMQKKSVRALFINVFGGITHCDEVANGIILALVRTGMDFPVVIRLVGTNDVLAKELLTARGFSVQNSFEDACKKAANLFD